MKKIFVILICGVLSASMCVAKEKDKQQANRVTTFTNPVIFADYPDMDVIRVGDDFYMVSTTMHLMPGAPIMKSKDLVNWELINYLFDELDDSEVYNLNGGNAYGRGQWAACIRYHKGKFYALYGTNNTGKSYLYSTTDPAGKWDKVVIDEYLHDPSMLFDEDGRVYVTFNRKHVRHIREFNADLTALKPDGLNLEELVEMPEGLLEGTHFYKINGKYYLTLIWWPKGGRRTQICFRSDHVAGPYNEQKIILDDNMGYRNNGIAQGCFIDMPDGRWFSMMFQDHGAVGRIPYLMPLRWEDGWPMLGDAYGKVPPVMEKPVQGYPTIPLVVSDEFTNLSKEKGKSRLPLYWQWNHNPDNSLWTLTERPGYLRLKTGKVVSTIVEARNSLTQRTEGPACAGSISMDISNMQDGDCAGLSAFCYHYGYIGVQKENGRAYLVMVDRGNEVERKPLEKKMVNLKVDFDFDPDVAFFYYSLDGGKNWNQLGQEMKTQYTTNHFVGYRFALFNYATLKNGGFVDFDYFRYERKTNLAGK